jgi:hypothetical protein
MPTFTKAQKKAILAHVLNEVIEDTEDGGTPGPIALALIAEGIQDVHDILNYSDDLFATLQYTPTDGAVTTLTRPQGNMLKMLKGFIGWKSHTGEAITMKDQWMALTFAELGQFRATTTWFGMTNNGTAILMPIPGTGFRRDPVAEFNKGIKRDIHAYSTIKQDQQWDNWNRGTIGQARAQDVSNVLNPNYNPTYAIELALFNEQTKFVFGVFEKHLQTDKGKALVRKYHATSNSQAIYKELTEYALESRKASLDTATLLSYITSARLGNGKWKGSAHAFILHWQDQVRQFGDLVGSPNYFPDDLLRIMLENFITKVPELRADKLQSDQHKTQTGNELSYLQYGNLVLSAAQQHDGQFVHQHSKTRPRQVYEHEIEHTSNQGHDINSNVHEILEVHQTTFERGGPHLKKNQWDHLGQTPGDQDTWDSLSNEGKRIVLEPMMGGTPQHRKASLHDITAHAYIQANMHEHQREGQDDKEDSASAPNVSTITDIGTENNSTLLAHMMKRAPLPPGDITRILSSSMAKKDKTVSTSSEITVNGKKYGEANIVEIQYLAPLSSAIALL